MERLAASPRTVGLMMPLVTELDVRAVLPTIRVPTLKRAVSRANGTKFGRRTKVADPAHVATARRMKADGHTARDVAKYLGVSRATLYGIWLTKPRSPRAGQATPLHPRRGYRPTCAPPAGARQMLLTPGGGTDNPGSH